MKVYKLKSKVLPSPHNCKTWLWVGVQSDGREEIVNPVEQQLGSGIPSLNLSKWRYKIVNG